ncbi:DUF5991 domain-containing protein [Trinickia diaoshuihuensis]|uniref:DUF5991 domain-containing protein n=1 Tax=Trinickia diaoshuihuensis TaxID=2292265 RepID=UPI0013C2E2CE|nr:DUF5991 domain-containing protein [Trinickia diaoshuihuensis]
MSSKLRFFVSVRWIGIFLLVIASRWSHAEVLPEKWVGSYSYQHVMGHAVGEAAPAWAFNLTVTANGDCELTWQGYQKNDDILCKASGNTNGLTIYYTGSADGGAGGPAAPLFYRRNEKLMRLEVIKGSAKF